jgi:hypothetical protein
MRSTLHTLFEIYLIIRGMGYSRFAAYQESGQLIISWLNLFQSGIAYGGSNV